MIVDRNRVAILWLLDPAQTHLEIPEELWPPVTHGDDKDAARTWASITGLKVTIRTITQTTTASEPQSGRIT